MLTRADDSWRVSLHGGHSGQYCEHAVGTLREVLEAAVEVGFRVFGVSEHVPRPRRFLYESELEKGYTVERLEAEFRAYAVEIQQLRDEFADRLTVLCGYEMEVVPTDVYPEVMARHRARHQFDYTVGAVHFLADCGIDGPAPAFKKALAHFGGLETLAIAYYRAVAQMVESTRPEVVAHLDLIRLNAEGSVDSPSIRRAALEALEVIHKRQAILELSTAGYRKGLGGPYPDRWLVRAAAERGIPFCFGDDSHGPEEVGAGLDEARQYLLESGVSSITTLDVADGALIRRVIAL